MKYSFLLPFWSRNMQIKNTLTTFMHWYKDRDDFEIIVILDDKCSEEEVCEARDIAYDSVFPMKVFTATAKNQRASPAHFNQAAKSAVGDYFVLTSPEVMHCTDVLGGFDKYLEESPRAYVLAACGRAPEFQGLAPYEELNFNFDMWLQHTEHRPSDYHFCSVIHRDTYYSVNGFDEIFGGGVAYDDNDFRDSLIVDGVQFIQADELMSIHQKHRKDQGKSRKAAEAGNRAIYLERCKERGLAVREN